MIVKKLVSRGFMEDNPCGTLSKSKLMDMYSGVLSKHKANNFIDEIFDKYDTDHDGSINFKVSEGVHFILHFIKKYLGLCENMFTQGIKMKVPMSEHSRQ